MPNCAHGVPLTEPYCRACAEEMDLGNPLFKTALVEALTRIADALEALSRKETPHG